MKSELEEFFWDIHETKIVLILSVVALLLMIFGLQRQIFALVERAIIQAAEIDFVVAQNRTMSETVKPVEPVGEK